MPPLVASEALGIKVIVPADTAGAFADLFGNFAKQVRQSRIEFPFATNRARVGTNGFSSDLSDSLTYGAASIMVVVPATAGDTAQAQPNSLTIKQRAHGEFMGELVGASRPEDVLVFVHGYRTSFVDACVGFGEFVYELRKLGFAGSTVLFSWPSVGGINAILAEDRQAAEASGPTLAGFLQELADAPLPGGAKRRRIHVLGHSMGTRVITLAIEKVKLPGNPQKPFANIVFLAGEVGNLTLAPRFKFLTAGADRLTFYSSRNDYALQLAQLYPVLALWAEKQAIEAPIGASIWPDDAVENIDCSRRATGILGFSFNHSYYNDDPCVRRDVALLLRGQGFSQRLPPLKNDHDQRTQMNYWYFPDR